jgi:hypothetical protein
VAAAKVGGGEVAAGRAQDLVDRLKLGVARGLRVVGGGEGGGCVCVCW